MVETVKGFQRMLLVTVTQALVGDAREDANERLEPKTLSGAIRILTRLLMSIDKMGGWVGGWDGGQGKVEDSILFDGIDGRTAYFIYA